MAKYRTAGEIHYEMMRRCYDPKCVSFGSYGAKGIKVCDEWHDREVFKQWARENGYSKELKLCRKDFSKDYAPDNCYFGESYKSPYGKNHAYKEAVKKRKQEKVNMGLSRYTDSSLYKTYYAMHTRCEKPNHINYNLYGGRGITVCDEWSGKDGFKNFHRWAMDNNWRPGLTLDRIDNDKGYSPDNCHFATQREQVRNRRTTKLYDYKGFRLMVSEIAEIENISSESLRYRLNKGITIQEAIKQCKNLKKGGKV